MQHTSPAVLSIMVNGEERSIAEGETIAGLIAKLNLVPERLAVELDRRIVKRAAWNSTILSQGSQLEIVQFVGGG